MSGPVLITGGAGSVGRQLVEMFAEAGRAVRVFDLPMMDFSGLEDRDSLQIVRGDITDADGVRKAVEGADAILHLAAILPPNSERNRDVAFNVNVGGTQNIISAMESANPDARLVFTSSISTYGDTSAEDPPVTTSHSQSAIDIYADSKIEGEKLIHGSSLTNTISLRIAAIAVPAFLEPPDPWPFMEDQRVEMVHRDDVADALFASADAAGDGHRVFNIGGGPDLAALRAGLREGLLRGDGRARRVGDLPRHAGLGGLVRTRLSLRPHSATRIAATSITSARCRQSSRR